MYAIAESKAVTRGNLFGEKPVFEWVISPYYGFHEKNIDAKRSFIESWFPNMKGQSDERMKIQFDAQRRNVGIAKVIKIKETP